MTALRFLRLLLAAVLAAGLSTLGPLPSATAAARVTLENSAGAAVVDPTYATTLTVSGRGFQSIRGGHGGVYVFFGTVTGRWQPSKGGRSGENYLYVPDAESSDNQGYQRFLAFPGSDTSGSASGTLKADGSFSTTITVPGARFQAVGRDGTVKTVDCRKVRCGVITVGAHGVNNARNETFTPVRVADLYDGASPSASPSTTSPSASEGPATSSTEPGAAATAAPQAGAKPAAAGPQVLEVDRASATAGRVLPFRARGLPAGTQVSVVLDDGIAGAGPFLVGADGGVAGVLSLPADLEGGTHELRVYGAAGADEDPATVRFAVAAAAADADPVDAAGDTADGLPWGPIAFAVSAVVFAAVLLRTLLLVVRRRRTAGGGA